MNGLQFDGGGVLGAGASGGAAPGGSGLPDAAAGTTDAGARGAGASSKRSGGTRRRTDLLPGMTTGTGSGASGSGGVDVNQEVYVMPQGQVATFMADYWPVVLVVAVAAGYGIYYAAHGRHRGAGRRRSRVVIRGSRPARHRLQFVRSHHVRSYVRHA
ncbi:MAG TPA: hypothetical protein VHI13_11780 [Candidatus Kapabacteria bacterium]|nr:hypothetical protein [Candidatus Kapabacteria bacterium]